MSIIIGYGASCTGVQSNLHTSNCGGVLEVISIRLYDLQVIAATYHPNVRMSGFKHHIMVAG